MKLAILSNINLDILIKKLNDKFNVYNGKGYAEWIQEITTWDSSLYNFKPNSIFIILDGEELFRGVIDDISKCKEEIENYFTYIENAIISNNEIMFFVSDIDLPNKKLLSAKEINYNKEIEFLWYKKIYEISTKYNNLILFNLKNLIEQFGRENFYSAKLWYLGLIKYSINGQNLIINYIENLALAQSGKRKKCLILDLDNTLWGGIAGEEGINGITLSEFKEGARYKDFQKRIKDIKNTGIIIAIVSKNNEREALDIIKHHSDMVLKTDDFVTMKINWNEKVKNIEEISKELNIGIDSMIFIDDNPIEREHVKDFFKNITVPDFPLDTSMLEKFITNIYYEHFYILDLLDEDKEKTIMYKNEIERNEFKNRDISADDFYRRLQTKIFIKYFDRSDVARVVQLCQKTNQFNVTSKRYSERDVIDLANSINYDIYIASVEDKFGNNGQTIVLILDKKNKDIVKIDLFLMSCRIMGRNVEYNIQQFIIEKLKLEGYKQIEAEYIPTEKNKPVEELFERLGYRLIHVDENGIKKYIFDIEEFYLHKNKIFGELIKI